MAGSYKSDSDINSFVSGIGYSSNRCRRNIESIFAKYDKPFPDDDLINLSTMTINRNKGKVLTGRQHALGKSDLLSTKHKEELMQCQLREKNSNAPKANVSSYVLRKCASILETSRLLAEEDVSDADTIDSECSTEDSDSHVEDEEELEEEGEKEKDTSLLKKSNKSHLASYSEGEESDDERSEDQRRNKKLLTSKWEKSFNADNKENERANTSTGSGLSNFSFVESFQSRDKVKAYHKSQSSERGLNKGQNRIFPGKDHTSSSGDTQNLSFVSISSPRRRLEFEQEKGEAWKPKITNDTYVIDGGQKLLMETNCTLLKQTKSSLSHVDSLIPVSGESKTVTRNSPDVYHTPPSLPQKPKAVESEISTTEVDNTFKSPQGIRVKRVKPRQISHETSVSSDSQFRNRDICVSMSGERELPKQSFISLKRMENVRQSDVTDRIAKQSDAIHRTSRLIGATHRTAGVYDAIRGTDATHRTAGVNDAIHGTDATHKTAGVNDAIRGTDATHRTAEVNDAIRGTDASPHNVSKLSSTLFTFKKCKPAPILSRRQTLIVEAPGHNYNKGSPKLRCGTLADSCRFGDGSITSDGCFDQNIVHNLEKLLDSPIKSPARDLTFSATPPSHRHQSLGATPPSHRHQTLGATPPNHRDQSLGATPPSHRDQSLCATPPRLRDQTFTATPSKHRCQSTQWKRSYRGPDWSNPSPCKPGPLNLSISSSLKQLDLGHILPNDNNATYSLVDGLSQLATNVSKSNCLKRKMPSSFTSGYSSDYTPPYHNPRPFLGFSTFENIDSTCIMSEDGPSSSCDRETSCSQLSRSPQKRIQKSKISTTPYVFGSKLKNDSVSQFQQVKSRHDSDHRPVGQASNNKPVGQASNHRPVGHVSNHRPVGQASNHRPVGQASNHRPFGQASNHRPVGQASSHRPVGQASNHRPFGHVSNHRPVGEASNHRPVGHVSNHRPVQHCNELLSCVCVDKNFESRTSADRETPVNNKSNLNPFNQSSAPCHTNPIECKSFIQRWVDASRKGDHDHQPQECQQFLTPSPRSPSPSFSYLSFLRNGEAHLSRGPACNTRPPQSCNRVNCVAKTSSVHSFQGQRDIEQGYPPTVDSYTNRRKSGRPRTQSSAGCSPIGTKENFADKICKELRERAMEVWKELQEDSHVETSGDVSIIPTETSQSPTDTVEDTFYECDRQSVHHHVPQDYLQSRFASRRTRGQLAPLRPAAKVIERGQKTKFVETASNSVIEKQNTKLDIMFPASYIEKFSPNNPTRIDSDATAYYYEQQTLAKAPTFKRMLRSFRPKRNSLKSDQYLPKPQVPVLTAPDPYVQRPSKLRRLSMYSPPSKRRQPTGTQTLPTNHIHLDPAYKKSPRSKAFNECTKSLRGQELPAKDILRATRASTPVERDLIPTRLFLDTTISTIISPTPLDGEDDEEEDGCNWGNLTLEGDQSLESESSSESEVSLI